MTQPMPTAPRAPHPLRVTSFNLRFPAPDRNPWEQRLPVAVELLSAWSPHLVGTQEGTLSQLTALVDALPARYAWVGTGHTGDDSGEFTAVLYDTDRISVDATDVRWLSDRPEVRGSVSWGARRARTATVLDCRDISTGTAVRFISTHLDHRSPRARRASVDVIAQLAQEASGETVVTGDFNEFAGGELHHELLRTAALVDSVDQCPSDDADINTFHAYRGPRREGKRIDWILCSAGLRPISTAVDMHGRGRQYPSDHFPIHAELLPVEQTLLRTGESSALR